jgi:hypothetical protein
MPAARQLQAFPARGRRRDAGSVKASARDLELLGFIGEQYAVTLPQLARLIGRSHNAARWLRARWERAGWARGAALLVGEPVFVWLTRRGQRAAGSEYSLWRPSPGALAHVAAVNEVRLYVTERHPDAQWVCERELVRDRRVHRPDALVLIAGREVPVEVELTHKRSARSERIMRELVARYGQASYFAAEGVRRTLEEVARDLGGRVQVQALPLGTKR